LMKSSKQKSFVPVVGIYRRTTAEIFLYPCERFLNETLPFLSKREGNLESTSGFKSFLELQKEVMSTGTFDIFEACLAMYDRLISSGIYDHEGVLRLLKTSEPFKSNWNKLLVIINRERDIDSSRI